MVVVDMLEALRLYPYTEEEAFIDAVKLPIVFAVLEPVGTYIVVEVFAGTVAPDTIKLMPFKTKEPLPGVPKVAKLNVVVAYPCVVVLVAAMLAVALV
jgi:hypothetical protein